MPRVKLLLGTLFILSLIGCEAKEPTKVHPAPSPSNDASTPSPTPSHRVNVDLESRRPAMRLSDYHLFLDLKNQIPNEGVIPYQLNSSHFVDYAISRHYLYLPPDTQATYRENEVYALPVGTILAQSLSFQNDLRDPSKGERLVETRLLIHQTKGWLAVPYLWNKEQTDARRAVIGGKTKVDWLQQDGSLHSHIYVTPDMNQCKRCHKNQDRVQPIGLRTRNLNLLLDDGKNQLARWANSGLLAEIPPKFPPAKNPIVWQDPSTATTDKRARAWLDINCAHCHNPNGAASVSGLDLSFQQQMPVKYGVYKPPVAAGRGSSGYKFGINPGSPQTSFLLHRIRSTDPGVMMPTVGRSLVDKEGTALIEQWIREMHPDQKLAERALNPVKAYRDALQGGDARRGKQLFYSTAKCSSCHQATPKDRGNVGPSLIGLASRAKREYLLESIVAPSAKVVDKFAVSILETDDGKVYSGIILSEDANEVMLRLADATQIKLLKSSLEQQTLSKNSLMPSMANILSTQDVADLIEFLLTLKEP